VTTQARLLAMLAGVAAVALVGSGLAYVAFVRPGTRLTGAGVVVAREVLAPEMLSRRTMTPRGPTVAERRIALPARFRYTLRVDGETAPLRYSADTLRIPRLAVGQPVEVRYERRGLPPLWRRAFVEEVRPRAPR
jgi:hypothetical protein